MWWRSPDEAAASVHHPRSFPYRVLSRRDAGGGKLSSQAADGSTTAKVALGLLADTDCWVLFRQSTTEVAQAAELLQLTEAEAELRPKLSKGRALSKVGQHTAVLQHVVPRASGRSATQTRD